MRASLPILLASTLLAAATASGAQEPQRISVGPTGQKLKVGVVDIDKALGDYVRVKEAEKEVGRRFGASERKLKARDRALAERENELKLSPLNPNSDKYREDMKKLQEDRESHKAAWKQYVGERSRLEARRFGVILADLLEAIRRYGTEEGFDLILKHESVQDPRRPYDPSLKIRYNAVLFYSGAIDVTSEIVAYLNSAHARGERLAEALAARLAAQKKSRRLKKGAPPRSFDPNGRPARAQAADKPDEADPFSTGKE